VTELRQIYKCNICGNIVEVLHAGVGELVCCGQPMELLEEKTAGGKDGLSQSDKDVQPVEGKEKHVPVIEQTGKGVKVKVGSVEHPMEDNHQIEWIEILTRNWVIRKHLKAGDKPEADFWVKKDDVKLAREHCNVHGLWKS